MNQSEKMANKKIIKRLPRIYVNPYLNFLKQFTRDVRAHAAVPIKKINKIASMRWREMTPNELLPYLEMAEVAQAEGEGRKYRPRKKKIKRHRIFGKRRRKFINNMANVKKRKINKCKWCEYRLKNDPKYNHNNNKIIKVWKKPTKWKNDSLSDQDRESRSRGGSRHRSRSHERSRTKDRKRSNNRSKSSSRTKRNSKETDHMNPKACCKFRKKCRGTRSTFYLNNSRCSSICRHCWRGNNTKRNRNKAIMCKSCANISHTTHRSSSKSVIIAKQSTDSCKSWLSGLFRSIGGK